MVEMDNIRYVGDNIVMFCYPEGDKNKQTELIMNASTYEVVSPSYMNTYLSMARFKIVTILKSGEPLPEKEMSIWC